MSGLRFAALAALVLSGCAGAADDLSERVTPEKRFPIAVEPQMQTYRLPYDGATDAAFTQKLQQIATDYAENGNGTLTISASSDPSAAATTVDQLASLGIPRSKLITVPAVAGEAPQTVAISYVRYRTAAIACGNWSENLSVTYSNHSSPNLGCATQHNFAVMIADPRDLVSPKPLGVVDVQRRLNVLDKYRQGDITAAAKSAEQSGAVSSVANTAGSGGGGGGGGGGGANGGGSGGGN